MTTAVTVAKVDRVVLIELIITFTRVLVLAILGRPECLQERKPARVCNSGRSSYREKIVEGSHAINREVFYPERIRYSQFVSGQNCQAHIALRVRPGGARGDVISPQQQRVGRSWLTRDTGVEVSAHHRLQKGGIRCGLAVNDPAGNVEALAQERMNATPRVVNVTPCRLSALE